MNNGLSGIKNIIWALAIVVALAAVLVGLIITMVLGFGGQRQDGTLYLGEGSGLSAGGSAGTSAGNSGVDGGLDGGAGAMALPGSQDTGLEYLFNLTFLCDESFSAVGSFGANFGSTASAQVWLPAGGSFPSAGAASTKIIYPNDGTEKSPADAAGLYQPARLVIYLGGDGLGSAHIRDGQADNVRPRHLHGLDLGHRGFHVPGLGVAHGLDGDRGAAADLHPAHVYFFHGISFIHHFFTILNISLNITNAISASSSIMPAAWI